MIVKYGLKIWILNSNIKNKIYEIKVEIKLIVKISCANVDNFSLSSFNFAASLVAYVFIPNDARIIKYWIIELEKFTLPIDSGVNILDA